MARYSIAALVSVVTVALLGVGAAVWFVLGGLTGQTLVVLGVVVAFVVGLAAVAAHEVRRTRTPYW